jgi:hypothetical protein
VTDDDLAAFTVLAQRLETTARAHWDTLADGRDGEEYQAVMGVVRQAGGLRKSLEQLIVTRATKAQRAAAVR